ncbi:CHAT domain-containing protein [bacterium SCSIO 12741]|nr:CHAT domain-containing protein [bacterium SCSIO 12741]
MRRFKAAINLLAISLCLVISSSAWAQTEKMDKQASKKLEKTEKRYDHGEYHHAQVTTKRLMKKWRKKGYGTSQNYALFALYNVKYLEAIGNYFEVQDSLENALYYFSFNIKEDSSEYLNGLLLISDIYAHFGNQVLAYEYLVQADEFLHQSWDGDTSDATASNNSVDDTTAQEEPALDLPLTPESIQEDTTVVDTVLSGFMGLIKDNPSLDSNQVAMDSLTLDSLIQSNDTRIQSLSDSLEAMAGSEDSASMKRLVAALDSAKALSKDYAEIELPKTNVVPTPLVTQAEPVVEEAAEEEVQEEEASEEKRSLMQVKSDLSTNADSLLAFEIKRRMVTIQLDRGFFREVEYLIPELIGFQRSITKREFPNPDTTAKKSTIKLDKDEFKARQFRLAELYVLRADFYRERGDFSRASNLYYENERLIHDLVGKRSLPTIENEFGRAVMAENDGQLEKPYKEYKKIHARMLKIGISSHHKFFNEVAEKEIQSFIEADKDRKARHLFLKYKLDNMHKYGKTSVYYLNALMLENRFNNRKKRYKKAVKQEVKLKEGVAENVPDDHVSNLQFNDHFYDFYHRNHRVEEARIERETNVWIAKNNFGDNSPMHSIEQLKLAGFNVENEDLFEQSKQVYQDHFEDVIKYQLHEDHPLYIDFLRSYSKLKAYIDQYDEAYTISEQALKIAERKFGSSSELYGVILVDMSEINLQKGEFDQAEQQLEKATEVIRKQGTKKSLSYYMALKSLAGLYMVNGKFEKARDTYKKAYKLLKKSGEGGNENISSSEEMAELYITTGRYKGAEDILKSSIALNEKKYGTDHYRLVEPLSLYGKLYLITGDFIDAEKMVRRSMKISKTNLGDTSVAYMDNLALLAEVYVSMGNYDEAKNIYGDARKLIQKKFGNGNIREADILQKLAEVNFKSDDADLNVINAYLEEAKEIVTTNFNSSHPQYGELLEYQGKVYMLFGEHQKAEQTLADARTIWLELFGKNHLRTARNEMLTGDLEYLMGNFDKAVENYKDAAESYKSTFDDEHPGYIQARSNEAKSFYANGDFKNALVIYDETTDKYLDYLKKYFPSLSEKEKNTYWSSIKGDFEIYHSLAMNLDKQNQKAWNKVYDFRLATKAILLSSSTRLKERIVNSGDGDLIYRFQRYTEKKEMLTRGLAMSEEERIQNGINMPALEKEINGLEKELSEESEDFAKAFEQEEMNWKMVRKALNEGEYAMEIVRFRYFKTDFTDSIIYTGLILDQKSKKGPEVVLLDNGNKLESRYFKYYRNGIKYKAKDKYSYEQFWQDFDAKLEDNTTVFVSADGIYNQMNVETLKDSSGRFVIDKNNIYYVSNTRDIYHTRMDEDVEPYDNTTAAMFGNPEFAGSESNIDQENRVSSLEPLPGAEEEIKSINRLLARQNWRTTTFLGDEATEAEIKKVNSPRVFHVATHGFFMQEAQQDHASTNLKGDIADNPLLRSGLLFTGAGELLANNNIYDFNKKDGILTAYEAMNLNLDHTELVVLSACETGLGEVKSGEGVYGLQRSFIVAGSKNVIMTLFKVDDKVTQELMNDFYSNWLEGQDIRVAFQDAKKRIKEKYSEPIYWGSFVMIGL